MTACGTESLEWASSEQGVAPVGSNAVLVSQDVPATLAPNERMDVTVRMRNTGAASPANDWDTNYRLTNTGGGFFWGYTRVPAAAVPVEAQTLEEHDFNFVITAPASGSPTFRTRLYTDTGGATGFFGPEISVPITVNTDPTFLRKWGCSVVSDDIPTTMTPSEVRNVTITIRNAGTQSWTSGGFCLYSRDSPISLWGGVACPVLNTNVAGATQGNPGSGGTATFTFQIRAPATEGSYQFQRQMFDQTAISAGGVGFFDNVVPCIDRNITVNIASQDYDSTFVPSASNIDDPQMQTWQPGERRRMRITLTNTGFQSWLNNNDFLLYSRTTPASLWKPVPYTAVNAQTDTAENHTFVFYPRAPTTPGTYDNAWQMFSSSATPAFFGDLVSYPNATVSGAAPLQLDASVIASNVPTIMSRNQTAEFRITMRNDGFEAWDTTEFALNSVGNPNYIWGITSVPLPGATTVPPGGTYEFVFNVTAPATAGSYESRWQMATTAGGFTFGGIDDTTVVISANCGNSSVQPGSGESCDDGNIINGDGCDESCQIEPQTYDLAGLNAAGRTLYGVQSARELSNVAMGDLNADGVADIAAGSFNTVTTTNPPRALAGAVFVHSGSGFINNTETAANAGTMLRVVGAREFDYLGGGQYGSVVIGDVTGDTRPDLIVSAQSAACMDGTGSCGRVYVIRGGPTLPTGTLDLAAPPAAVAAQLVAPNDGDYAVALTVGDVTGDGVGDLVIGLPGANGGAGRVVVMAGGAGLSGTIQMTNANVTADITGAVANDRLGLTASIGNLNNAGPNDLLLGAGGHDSGTGGSDAGGAWAFFGPVTGNRDLGAGQFSVRWLGAGIRDRTGSSVKVADVTGDGAPDAVIGTNGTRFVGNVRFGTVDVWNGPFVAATTFDMNGAAVPDTRFQGRQAGADFGKCVGAADVNGDGISDLFGVSFLASGSGGGLVQAGELGVALGGTFLADSQVTPGTTPIVVFGGQDRGRMCMYPRGLATADINQDGRADFCVASPMGSVPASGLFNEGRVDCFLSPF